MYRKIAVPLDRSILAEGALPPALSLADRSHGELHLATVVPAFPLLAYSGEDPEKKERAAEKVLAAAGTYLEEVAGRIAEAGAAPTVRTHVLTGNPVRALHEWVVKEGVDQIVMTTHGRGRVQRAWLGSVADGLVRRCPCPVLLWRAGGGDPGPDLQDRPRVVRILVPLDGSELAAAILPWAGELARLHGAQLLLLSVAQNPPPVGSPYSPHLEFGSSPLETHKTGMRDYLSSLRDPLRELGIEAEIEVIEGPAVADTILAHAKRTGADVIALSTRGHGGATRMMLGSVADKVIRGSDVPVLVHRDTEEQ